MYINVVFYSIIFSFDYNNYDFLLSKIPGNLSCRQMVYLRGLRTMCLQPNNPGGKLVQPYIMENHCNYFGKKRITHYFRAWHNFKRKPEL